MRAEMTNKNGRDFYNAARNILGHEPLLDETVDVIITRMSTRVNALHVSNTRTSATASEVGNEAVYVQAYLPALNDVIYYVTNGGVELRGFVAAIAPNGRTVDIIRCNSRITRPTDQVSPIRIQGQYVCEFA